MDEMMRQKKLIKNVFSFYLTENEAEQSELLFGAIDHEKYTDHLKCHQVRDKLFWSLKLDDIKLNGVSLGLCDHKQCLVTPDSGTSYSTMPSWAMRDAEKMLPLKNNCINDHSFGTMQYTIDGVDYNIPSSHFMERFENSDGQSTCEFTITELDIKQYGQENLFILGDQFMQLYYTVFDRDDDVVCFAPAKHEIKQQNYIITEDGP